MLPALRASLFGIMLLVAADALALDRPNILLLVAEDMSPHLGSYADPVAKTPRLDQLATEGVRYSRAFTTAGVCAPSRAALVTGVHAISFGAQHMRSSTRPAGAYTTVPAAHIKAFPELLRAAGYYTYTDFKLDYQFSAVLQNTGPESIWDDEGFDTHWRNRPEGRPFFGLVNFMVTHESGVFTPLGSWPQNLTHLMMQISREWIMDFDTQPVTDPQDVVLPPYYPDTETVRRDVARHYDNVHFMDAQVGAILDQLETDGLADSTIVIFTTDHGDGLPRAKRELFDSGLHVPMIIRWPESLRPKSAVPGSWNSQLVSFVDLAPTILHQAGADAPPWLQGRDFLKETTVQRRFIFAARDRIDATADRQRAVRDDRYKYIRSWMPDQPGGHPSNFRDTLEMMRELWTLREAGELNDVQRIWFEAPGEERLFDTRSDPFELTNLASEPQLQPILETMRTALDEWLVRVDDTGDVDEDVMVETFWPGGEQPVTDAPELALTEAGVVVSATTTGASNEARVDDGAWQLATQPIPVQSGSTLEARSVRYGFVVSDNVSLQVP